MSANAQVNGGSRGPRRFSLGRLLITRNAAELLSPQRVLQAIRRHGGGDWRDLEPEDWDANNWALAHHGRLLSAYCDGRTRFWVITEADRSATTVLLPEDYWGSFDLVLVELGL